MDGVLLAVLLPFALPLMFLIACGNLMVFGDPRQIFFLQPRVGWKGKTFCIVKFRTMKSTASSALGSWSSGEDHLRVTSFGKFLRNAHLDELPQLFNIITGEMSFIGPRPEMVEIESWASEEIPGFSHRLAIRPGLAGLAQITQGYTGHDVAAYSKKLDINMAYMAGMSLALDLRIVLGTMVWMVRGNGWDWNQAQGTPEANTEASAEESVEANTEASAEASAETGAIESTEFTPADFELAGQSKQAFKPDPLPAIPEGLEPEWLHGAEPQLVGSSKWDDSERRAS